MQSSFLYLTACSFCTIQRREEMFTARTKRTLQREGFAPLLLSTPLHLSTPPYASLNLLIVSDCLLTCLITPACASDHLITYPQIAPSEPHRVYTADPASSLAFYNCSQSLGTSPMSHPSLSAFLSFSGLVDSMLFYPVPLAPTSIHSPHQILGLS